MRVDNYMISANKVFYFELIWFMISCVYSCTWRELSSMTININQILAGDCPHVFFTLILTVTLIFVLFCFCVFFFFFK
jgi:hypothetical protein